MPLLCPPSIHATETMWESRHSPEHALHWRQCSLGAHRLYHCLLYGKYETVWERRFCNRPLWFPESWIHAVGGCLCKNSEGEEICSCSGEMAIIFLLLSVKTYDIDRSWSAETPRCICKCIRIFSNWLWCHISLWISHNTWFFCTHWSNTVVFQGELLSRFSYLDWNDSLGHLYTICLQFTFASNAATIVGGCLVTNRYKLRLPAAFISAFVISVRLPPYLLTRAENQRPHCFIL